MALSSVWRGAVLVAAAAVAAAAGVVAMSGPADAATGTHSERVLFDGGGESLNGVTYHSFRIPSLIRTKAGSLIAFAEGRTSSGADFGNINLVFKKSTDQGKTWSDLR